MSSIKFTLRMPGNQKTKDTARLEITQIAIVASIRGFFEGK
jgi:hypothetical protein